MPTHELAVANISSTDHLAYLDSGPVPNSSDFVTIVLLHGIIFNGYNMERLLPFAHKHNVRLIIVTRKGYPGSSRYTEKEVKLVTKNPEQFFKETGALYLHFLHYILKNTHVCKATEDRSKGGICLAAWSLGNASAMWTLCENELVDQKVYDDLEQYWTTYMFIDPPVGALGARWPGEDILFDPLTVGDGLEAFFRWLTSYFKNPTPWDGTLTKLDHQGYSGRKLSISTWTDAEIERGISPSAITADVEVLTKDAPQIWLKKMTTEILLGRPKSFPRVRIEYLSATETCWHAVLAWHSFSNKRADLKEKGEDTGLRRTKFTLVPKANHFMHTDAPDGFMRILKTRLEEQSDAYTTFCTASLWD